MERIGRTSRNIPSGKAPKSLKTVRRSTPIHFVISRSCVRVTPPAPKSIENFGFRCFFVAKTLKMVWVKMWVNRLTHTLTHTRIGLKSTGEEAFAFSPVFLVLFCSHDLRHEAAHRLCGLVLLLPCGVGVGAECESSVIVAEHTADGFDVHAILQHERCRRVAQLVRGVF